MKKYIALLTLASFLCATPAWAKTYQVQPNDTLYQIAQRNHLSVAEIKSANNLSSNTIYPGRYLYLPTSSDTLRTYTVVKGDTLSKLAARYDCSVAAIKRQNGLSKDTIYVGQRLQIPSRSNTITSRGHQISLKQADIDLLAHVVYGEARGECFDGQVAVAAVVLNRLENSTFPNNIRDIVYQPLAFTATIDGQINLTPNTQAYAAVRSALSGYDPSCGATYYWNPSTATSDWIWSRSILLKIGNHVFGY